MLDFIDKGTTVEQNRKAVEICRKYNIKIFANIMFGLPTETKKEMDTTVNFVRWMKPQHFSPAVFTPYPGSYLYDYCRDNGTLLPFSHESFRRNPMSGAKVKGVKYWLVNYEIFKCDPHKLFIPLLLPTFIGQRGVNVLIAIKRFIFKKILRIK